MFSPRGANLFHQQANGLLGHGLHASIDGREAVRWPCGSWNIAKPYERQIARNMQVKLTFERVHHHHRHQVVRSKQRIWSAFLGKQHPCRMSCPIIGVMSDYAIKQSSALFSQTGAKALLSLNLRRCVSSPAI